MSIPQTSTSAFGVVGAVFAGGISAMLFLYALSHMDTMFGFFVVYLTAFPLFLAGLAGGTIAGLIAPLFGAVGLFLKVPSNVAFIYTFLFAIPSIVLTALALRYRAGTDSRVYWYPESFIMAVVALYPCIIFLSLVALSASHPGGLLAITTEAFNHVGTALAKQASPVTAATIRALLPVMSTSAPALLAWAWMLIMTLSMYCAQGLLKRQKWNIRETFSFRDLHTPSWMVYAFAATCLMGVLAGAPFNYIGTNLGAILGFPFFCVGLAIIHAWTATTRFETALLICFYVVFSVVLWLGFLITLLGAVDQWVDFRRRWCQPKIVHIV